MKAKICTLALAALMACSLRAQEVTAAINGVVTDPSGAAVSGAKVTAKDLDRGSVFPTVTDGSGFYNLPRLPVGRYEVRVEDKGFQTSVKPEVVLQLNQNAKIDFAMHLGDVNQSVEVTSEAPILETQTTQLGTVLDAKTNVQLPLATRNYVQLTLLAPGTVTTDPSMFTGAQSSFNGGRPLVNGNREQANNFLLDGMDNNQVSENDVAYAPSPDAIQEFNMITQNASAEFGNFMGGIISVSIKGGQNDFHGNAFEFFRNDQLNANNWANNFNGLPRPLLRWNEFGGSLGGRIIRDKLFFFADYQGSRFDQPATSSGFSVLTAAERKGDFSELLSLPTPVQLYNPYTHTPIPGNNLAAAGLVSPQASAIVNNALYPQSINGNLTNNAINTTHSYTNQDQGDVRLDWNVTDKDHFFSRYSQSHIENPTTNSIPLLYNSSNVYPFYNGVIDYTRSFGPSFVNELRGGVNYSPVLTGTLSGQGITAASVGIPDVPSDILPEMAITGGYASSIGNAYILQSFADTVIQAEDTAIITKGTHTMHVGFQAFRDRINTYYSGNAGIAGQFGFNGQYSVAPTPGAVESPEADFMMGLPYNVQHGISEGDWGQRSWIYGAFFQDDWRVTPNLTLNLGLRWELHTPWVEVHNRQSNFNLITGAIELPGQDGNNDALYNQYNGITNFQPRLGFAYSMTHNTVFRGAYTLSNFLEGTGTNLRLPLNPPFGSEHNVNYEPGLPTSTLADGYTIFGSQTGSNINYTGASLRLWGPNYRPAVSNQWNLSVQHQFGNTLTAQVAYVGQNNDHLVVPIWASQLVKLPDGSNVPGYFGGNPALLSQVGNLKLSDTVGIQNYNALQISVQKRVSNGLEFQANYTWSKCMANAVGYYGGYGQAVGNWYYWQDSYDSRRNYGPCYYDVTHALNGFVTYDVPFGRGRKYGSSVNHVVNAIAGDWSINAIYNWRGGFPFTIDSSTDNSQTNNPFQLADCIGTQHVYGSRNVNPSSGTTNGYQWFDPSAYANEQPNHFGSCGIGTIRGPGLHTVDLSLTKLFRFTERQNLEFRAEAINFTNTPILNAPNTTIGSTLGQITSSQGERNIQFGLKYSF